MREVFKHEEAMKALNLKLADTDYQALKEIAQSNGRSVQAQFRYMVKQLLSKQRKKL